MKPFRKLPENRNIPEAEELVNEDYKASSGEIHVVTRGIARVRAIN